MESIETKKVEECCPPFDPEKWNNKTLHWSNKPFIKTSVPTFFHIPYPPMIGRQVTRMTTIAGNAVKLAADKQDILLLFEDPHPFKSNILLSVTGKVPNANNVSLTGTFLSQVYDGEYNEIPKFIKKMDAYLNSIQKNATKYYVHYAHCPKCAEERGHNYMVLFAKITTDAIYKTKHRSPRKEKAFA